MRWLPGANRPLYRDLTKRIITALQVELTEGEQIRLYAKGTNNIEAYLKYLQADLNLNKMNLENNALGKKLAQEAIELDPDYAMAYRALAGAYRMEVYLGVSKNPRESKTKSFELLNKAKALDPNNAEILAALGFSYSGMGQHEEAIALSERAAYLEPNAADVHAILGLTLRLGGKPDRAISAYEKAIRLNPIPPSNYMFGLGHSYCLVGQYKEAINWCEKAVAKDPDSFIAQLTMTVVYSMAGKDEDAKIAAAEVRRLNPKYSAAAHEKRATLIGKEQYFIALRKAGLK